MADKTVADLRKMSMLNFNKISKNDLYDIIKKSAGEEDGLIQPELIREFRAMKDSFLALSNEMKTCKAQLDTIPIIQQEMNNLKDTVNTQSQILYNQQMYLEYLENKSRLKNIVITGVDEESPLEGASTDYNKCAKIFEKIDAREVAFTSRRIGRSDRGRHRPILVEVESKEIRNSIIEKASALKRSGDTYRMIYIKKDAHPAVRKEWGRLFEMETRERAKPENVGHDIRVDKERRVLLKDNIVIDRWNPSFFV